MMLMLLCTLAFSSQIIHSTHNFPSKTMFGFIVLLHTLTRLCYHFMDYFYYLAGSYRGIVGSACRPIQTCMSPMDSVRMLQLLYAILETVIWATFQTNSVWRTPMSYPSWKYVMDHGLVYSGMYESYSQQRLIRLKN